MSIFDLLRIISDAPKRIHNMSARAQAPEPLSGAAGSILRASNAEWVSGWGWTVQRLSSRRTGPRRESRQRRTAISVAAVLAGAAGILSQRHPPPNLPYPNTINNLKLPERDEEIMHSMDETTTNTPTDAAFERETTITLSDGDTLVRIWSARRKDITRMRKKPEIFTEIRAWNDGVNGNAEFTVPRDRFNIASAARPKRDLSEKQLATARANIAKLHDKAAA